MLSSSLHSTLAPHLATLRQSGLGVGVSGGADSVALLLALSDLKLPLRAYHCNFRLRGAESERDEAFVRQLCARLEIPLEVQHFDTRAEAQARGESIEMAARRLRYAWWSTLPHPIAVAHHADDNIETFLLHLLRGAGLRGLTGMAVDNDRRILRPLLHCTRRDILDFLAARGEHFVEDSSNTDTHHRRNFVRHRILPLLRHLNPSIDRTLLATIQRLRSAAAIYRIGLDTLDRRYAPRSTSDRIIIPLDTLRRDNPEVARTWLFEQLHPLGFEAAAIETMLHGRTGALWHTPPSAPTPYMATIAAPTQTPNSEVLEIAPTHRTPPHIEWRTYARTPDFRPARAPYRATFDAHRVQLPLTLRPPREGERFAPFGMTRGTKLISDYLTDRHRSRIDKHHALVLTDAQGILWLVGETVDHRAAITHETTQILEVEVRG